MSGSREKTHCMCVCVCVKRWVSGLVVDACIPARTGREEIPRSRLQARAGGGWGRGGTVRCSKSRHMLRTSSRHKPPPRPPPPPPVAAQSHGAVDTVEASSAFAPRWTFRWLLSSWQHTWSRKWNNHHGGAFKQAIWRGKQMDKARGSFLKVGEQLCYFEFHIAQQ